MKLNLGKRIVLFFHWLLSLCLAALTFGGEYIGKLYAKIEPVVGMQYLRIALIAFVAIYAVLCIAVLIMIFRRSGARSERGFITMDSSETGRVRIAVGAIEQMVKQAAGTVDGIADMRISIASQDDAIAININVSVVNGSHVPTVTMNMQRAIRQFVELNCGVAVRSVSVSVQTVVNPGDSAKRGKKSEVKAAPVVQPAPEPQQEPVYEEIPVAAEIFVEEPVAEEIAAEQPEYICEEPTAEEPAVEEAVFTEPEAVLESAEPFVEEVFVQDPADADEEVETVEVVAVEETAEEAAEDKI